MTRPMATTTAQPWKRVVWLTLLGTAGSLGLPDLAKTAAPQALDELVAWDGLSLAFNAYRHGRVT